MPPPIMATHANIFSQRFTPPRAGGRIMNLVRGSRPAVAGGPRKADMGAQGAAAMVGPRDGGFGFDQSRKYTSVDNLDEVCVQCQAGQHARCLAREGKMDSCECEQCIVFGGA